METEALTRTEEERVHSTQGDRACLHSREKAWTREKAGTGGGVAVGTGAGGLERWLRALAALPALTTVSNANTQHLHTDIHSGSTHEMKINTFSKLEENMKTHKQAQSRKDELGWPESCVVAPCA